MINIIKGMIRDQFAEHAKMQIETIQSQNQRSLDDRQYLHDELRETKASLKRLERAVKTGEYP